MALFFFETPFNPNPNPNPNPILILNLNPSRFSGLESHTLLRKLGGEELGVWVGGHGGEGRGERGRHTYTHPPPRTPHPPWYSRARQKNL